MSETDITGFSRRRLLQGASLAAAAGWARSAARAEGNGQVAVVFLSRSNNTRMLAGHLSRSFDAELIEIRPRDPWPEDYENMVAWATRWRDSDALLPLEPTPDLSRQTTLFLGFPICGMALPAPMRSSSPAPILPARPYCPSSPMVASAPAAPWTRSPSTPSCMKRSCHRQTQGFDLPVSRMIAMVPSPSAVARMILVRHTTLTGVLRSAAMARSRLRSAPLTSKHTFSLIRRA